VSGERLQPGRRKPEQQPSQEQCLGGNSVIVDGAVIVKFVFPHELLNCEMLILDQNTKFLQKSKMTLMV
jgi:hypothetical protein